MIWICSFASSLVSSIVFHVKSRQRPHILTERYHLLAFLSKGSPAKSPRFHLSTSRPQSSHSFLSISCFFRLSFAFFSPELGDRVLKIPPCSRGILSEGNSGARLGVSCRIRVLRGEDEGSAKVYGESRASGSAKGFMVGVMLRAAASRLLSGCSARGAS